MNYLVGFGIVERCPYSVTSCPDIYVLSSIVGILVGLPRSVNAVMITSISYFGIQFIAKIMAYAMKTHYEYGPKLVDRTDHPSEIALREWFSTRTGNRTPNGTEYFVLIDTKGIPEDINDWAASRLVMYTNIREKTILHHMKSAA